MSIFNYEIWSLRLSVGHNIFDVRSRVRFPKRLQLFINPLNIIKMAEKLVTKDKSMYLAPNTKTYIRCGRRFVELKVCKAVDYTGLFYNKDKTFTRERTPDSIGICVLQTAKKCYICSIKYYSLMKWEDAKKACTKFPGYIKSGIQFFHGNAIFPSIDLLMHAYINFRHIFPKYGYVWSSTEYDESIACLLDLSSGAVITYDKVSGNYVFAFLELDIV